MQQKQPYSNILTNIQAMIDQFNGLSKEFESRLPYWEETDKWWAGYIYGVKVSYSEAAAELMKLQKYVKDLELKHSREELNRMSITTTAEALTKGVISPSSIVQVDQNEDGIFTWDIIEITNPDSPVVGFRVTIPKNPEQE